MWQPRPNAHDPGPASIGPSRGVASARAVADAFRFKIAFIGSHGVGKTTLCYGLAARLKANDVTLEIVHEVARRCPLPINEQTSLAAQLWILHTQISEEIVACQRYPVVLCDRSALDNYVYLLLAAGGQPSLEGLIGHWMATYDLLVTVPITAAPNPDGLRATDPAFQRAVEDRLLRELDRRKLAAIHLAAHARGDWISQVEQEVLRRLAPSQLPLL